MLFGLFSRLVRPPLNLAKRPFHALLGQIVSDTLGRTLFNSQLFRTFKMKASVKLRCQHCYFARRAGRLYVRCKAEPRHKQRQGRATRKQQTF